MGIQRGSPFCKERGKIKEGQAEGSSKLYQGSRAHNHNKKHQMSE